MARRILPAPAMPGRGLDASWRESAACLGADTELFFPVGSAGPAAAGIRAAKAFCGGCPVRACCLAYALDTGQTAGIWGGYDENERRFMRQGAAPLCAHAGRNGSRSRGGYRRRLDDALPPDLLPFLGSSAAPDAVAGLVFQRERQALLADRAPGADRLGPRDLRQGWSSHRDGKEQVRVGMAQAPSARQSAARPVAVVIRRSSCVRQVTSRKSRPASRVPGVHADPGAPNRPPHRACRDPSPPHRRPGITGPRAAHGFGG